MTPLTARLARRFGILDRPDEGHKHHTLATPYLGGVAIIVALVFPGLLRTIQVALRGGELDIGLAIGVGIAVALGLVGLLDDVRGLPASARFLAQGAAAAGAWAAGFRVQATPWEGLDFVLTMLWLVGIANAFNLLDNMDGLSAGLAGIAALSFGVLAFVEEMTGLSILALALGGAALGFLAHNRHPAKIFMGDAGSLFLGFLLALIGLRLRFDNLVQVTFLVPVVVLGLPIFDTTLVVLSRLRARRPVLVGGRDHVSHRLVATGLPVKAAVGLLYWSGLCLGWLGLVISRANVQVGWMLLGFVIALGLFFGVMLFRVPVYGPREPVEVLEDDAATADGAVATMGRGLDARSESLRSSS